MSERITSLDPGYQPGDLSVFPEAYDDKTTLYEVSNFAETQVMQAVPYNGKYIIVEDASRFPKQGLICLGPRRTTTGGKDDSPAQTLYYNTGVPSDTEIIYYGSRTDTIFRELQRGYVGSRQNAWPVGTYVANSVMAEPHNACKDAIIQIQRKMGTKRDTDPNSMYGRLLSLEDDLLTPRPYFRAYPKSGPPALKVRFQNVCNGQVVRYFWEFGDGTVSLNPNPTHTYKQEGNYTVRLTVTTSTRGSGVLTKQNYISVSRDLSQAFFYALPVGDEPLSQETAQKQGKKGTTMRFVDQTPGDIRERYWVFGDDSKPEAVTDPYRNTIDHVYQAPGQYDPTLLVVYAKDGSTEQVHLPEPLVII